MEKFNEYNLMNESMSTQKSLVILRGVPGAGKSTFAELIAGGNTDIICCADDYFMKDGKYMWNRNEIGNAHAACREKCAALIEKSAPLIVVANTNVKDSEFSDYIKMGEDAGYKVFTVIVENRHGNRNVHNVSGDTVDQMRRKFSVSL